MNLPTIVTRALGQTEAFSKKHGPTILTAAGVAGFGVTTVLVGKAVLRSQEKARKLKIRVEAISDRDLDEKYTRKQQTHDLGQLVIHDGFVILRDFAPAILVGSASVACILVGHGMLKNQRKALVAAYASLDASYRAYRRRVVQEIGTEREAALHQDRFHRFDIDEEGLPCEIIDFSDTHGSPYARFFDESSSSWSRTPEYNYVFLKAQERYANDQLTAYGYLFLNDVYRALGLSRTQTGQVVGWKKHGDGDGFVSFGLDQIYDENSRAFTNGLEAVVYLDFNVDGIITID